MIRQTAAAGLVVLALASVAGCGTSTATSAASTTSGATASATAAAATTASTAPSTPAPATGSLTSQQEKAVAKAEVYLDTDAGFSRGGLIKMLSSKFEGDFAVADATAAVDSLHIDYNMQAVLAAKSYISLGFGDTSPGGVTTKLEDSLDLFTPAQAAYGAAHAS